MSQLKTDKTETNTSLKKDNGFAQEGGLRTREIFKQSSPQSPLISVITVVFNCYKEIEDTILSIIHQQSENLEFIIVDGGSTDGTLDIIKKYDDKIDYWISAKDKGIYDAMNKGLSLSRGTYAIHINAGDILMPEALTNFEPYLDGNNTLVFGKVKYNSGKMFTPSFNWKLYIKNSIHHQGVFYRIDTIRELGGYDIAFGILADYDLNLRLYRKGIQSGFVDTTIANCLDFGVSDIPRFKNYREEIIIRHKYLNLFLSLPLDILTLVRFFLKRTMRNIKLL